MDMNNVLQRDLEVFFLETSRKNLIDVSGKQLLFLEFQEQPWLFYEPRANLRGTGAKN